MKNKIFIDNSSYSLRNLGYKKTIESKLN